MITSVRNLACAAALSAALPLGAVAFAETAVAGPEKKAPAQQQNASRSLGLALIADAGQVAVGSQVTFTATVTNSLAESVLYPRVEGSVSGAPLQFTGASGPLAAGQQRVFTAKYTVTAADAARGRIDTTAKAAADNVKGTEFPSAPATTRVTARPAAAPAPANYTVLPLSVVPDSGQVAAGRQVTLTATLANSLADAVFNARVEGSASGAPLQFTGASGPLAAGQQRVFTAKYTVTAADAARGYVDTTAKATANLIRGTAYYSAPAGTRVAAQQEAPPNPGQAVTSVQLAQITADKSRVTAVGQQVTYTATATNTGNVPLHNVRINGVVHGIVTLPYTGSSESLPAGQSRAFTAKYTVTQADLNRGYVESAAYATANGPSGGEVGSKASATRLSARYLEAPRPGTMVPAVQLAPPADSSVVRHVGQQLTIVAYVTSPDQQALTNVRVDGAIAGTPVQFAGPAELAAGQSHAFVANYTVTQADLDRGYVETTAMVNAFDPQGVAVSSAADILKTLAK